MSHSDTDKDDQKTSQDNGSSTVDPMEELRQLILGPEKAEIKVLTERLDTPSIHARDVSKALPEAIILGAKQDGKLATALMPTVEEVLKASVKKDIGMFTDILFPIMGPAIRKSISESFRQMIQSLNNALEQSFSLQGLKWRFESVRTGKPFAEVVLLNMLLYRVDQVFLIHKETGLLLHHVSAPDVAFQDADLVSGMLTAIQDFVRDYFSTEGHQSLDTIQVGEVTVWIEQGPSAILAGAIRGNAPEELRLKFKSALENIHLEKHDELESFEGETDPFESIRHHLEACLEAKLREKEKKSSPLLPILLSVVIVAMGIWIFFSYRGRLHRSEYLTALRARDGIVVTEVENRGGRLVISGLRDPMAVRPEAILAQSKLNPEKVLHQFKPYQALDPSFTLKRATKAIHPPDTVSLTLEEGVLTANGAAPYQWIRDARRLAPAVPGIHQFSDDTLGNTDLQDLAPPATVFLALKDGRLTARGSAPNEWIVQTRKRVVTIAGIDHYSDDEVTDLDAAELAAVKTRLEETVFPFRFNTAEHTAGQADDLKRIGGDIDRFIELALKLRQKPFIEVVGHTDRSGSDRRNMKLSLERAIFIRERFVSGGTKPDYLGARGVGSREPLREELTEADKELNRSITLRPYLTGPPT